MCYFVIWSPEAWMPQCWRIQSKTILLGDAYDLNFFSWREGGCTQCIPANFHVASKWWHHDSLSATTICSRQRSKFYIMSHYLPHNAADMHHPQYGTNANVPDTYVNCFLGVSDRAYGTHSENTLWHQRSCMSASTVMMFILNSFYLGWMVQCLSSFTTLFFSFTILRISDNRGLSSSCIVFHSLPAHLKQMDPIHHHCLQYTYSHHHCLQYTYSTTDSTPLLSSVHIQNHRKHITTVFSTYTAPQTAHHYCLQYTYSTTNSTPLPSSVHMQHHKQHATTVFSTYTAPQTAHHYCLQYAYSTTNSTPLLSSVHIQHQKEHTISLQYTYSTTDSTPLLSSVRIQHHRQHTTVFSTHTAPQTAHHYCLQYTYSTTDSTPPLSSVHIQHTSAYKLQQVDVHLLQETSSSPSGSLWTD